MLEPEAQIQQVRFHLRIIGQAHEQIALLRQVAQVASAFSAGLPDGVDEFH
jgi:hypothetical protein